MNMDSSFAGFAQISRQRRAGLQGGEGGERGYVAPALDPASYVSVCVCVCLCVIVGAWVIMMVVGAVFFLLWLLCVFCACVF